MAYIGYWQGEASPGRLVDGKPGGGNDLTQSLDPGNPATPTPVPEGALWLAGGQANFANAAQYEIAPASFPLATFLGAYTVQFWYQGKSGQGDGATPNFNTWYADDAVHFERVSFAISGSDITLGVNGSVGTELADMVIGSVDTNKLVRVDFGAVGFTSTVYVNNVAVATFTRLSDFTLPMANVWIMRSAVSWMYLDAFMLASGNGNAYLGPQPDNALPELLIERRRRWSN